MKAETLQLFLIIITILFSVVSGSTSILALLLLSFVKKVNKELGSLPLQLAGERSARKQYEKVQTYINQETEKEIEGLKRAQYSIREKLTETNGKVSTLGKDLEKVEKRISKLEDGEDGDT